MGKWWINMMSWPIPWVATQTRKIHHFLHSMTHRWPEGSGKYQKQWDDAKLQTNEITWDLDLQFLFIIYIYIYIIIYIYCELSNYLIQSYPLKSCLIFPSGSSHFFPSQTPKRNRFINPHESMLMALPPTSPEHKDIKKPVSQNLVNSD